MEADAVGIEEAVEGMGEEDDISIAQHTGIGGIIELIGSIRVAGIETVGAAEN